MGAVVRTGKVMHVDVRDASTPKSTTALGVCGAAATCMAMRERPWGSAPCASL